MTTVKQCARWISACWLSLVLAACGAGSNSSTDSSANSPAGSGTSSNISPAASGTQATANYSVGGTVSGLSGTVTLQLGNGESLSVNANGPFTFSTKLANAAAYRVAVVTAPANQTCTVSNGAGVVAGANVTGVSVLCAVNAYAVGGTASGLTGTLVLQNNAADNLTISTNGPFSFATPVAQGGAFAVSVRSNPAGQSCSVANGSGQMGNAPINNVTVTCTTNAYTIGGSLTGLSIGSVVLRDNGGDDLSLGANGSFTFPSAVGFGNPYSVTVYSQPANVSCTVTNAAGTVNGNVTNVSVTCTCASGYSACSGVCVNTSTNGANCGGCGVVCTANQACISGSCAAAPCSTSADCTGGDVCLGGTCQAPTCSDGVKDGAETAVDCGGGTCGGCAVGSQCLTGTDCQSSACTSGTCQAPSCFDGIKNGSETDIDCGGGACSACAAGNHCLVGSDCVSGVCSGGTCH